MLTHVLFRYLLARYACEQKSELARREETNVLSETSARRFSYAFVQHEEIAQRCQGATNVILRSIYVSKLIDFGAGFGLTLDDDSWSSHVRNDETSSTMIIDWQKAAPRMFSRLSTSSKLLSHSANARCEAHQGQLLVSAIFPDQEELPREACWTSGLMLFAAN
jgi:hypothetical protein